VGCIHWRAVQEHSAALTDLAIAGYP